MQNIKNDLPNSSLQGSEDWYRSIIESHQDAFCVTDLNGRFLEVNDSYCRLTGFTKSEILSMHMLDFETMETTAENDAHIQKIIETGEDFFVTKHRTKNGGFVDLEIKVHYHPVANGRLVAFLHDITKRKKAEEELKRGEKQIKTILYTTMDGFYLVDKDGQILETNDSYCNMIGYSREQLLKMKVRDIEAVDLDEDIKNRIQSILENGFVRFETRHRRKNGTIINIEASVNYLMEEEEPKLFCFMRDITERKIAENELLKLSRALNQSSASVVITNREGNIEFVNQTLCDLTGYSKEELMGKNPRIWKSGFHDKEYYKFFWDTLLAGNNCSGEILNKKKNGELYWESALISPLINETGEITHFVAVKEDITEKKNMISDLIKAKEMAESANNLKDAFIANISHEIRTPLNGVLGMTNLIRDSFEGTIKKEDEELFEGLEFSSRRIIRTVDMILNYSRFQVGEFHMNPVKINVSQICSDLLKQFNAASKIKSLDLSLQVKCSDTNIIADENSTIIAISNLIDNAIKYTNEGSVKVILRKGMNDDLILEVKDTGIGISDEYLDHVFEPYRQEHMGYGRAYDGIGLGLAMVKKVFDLNSVLIKVESKKGVGTTFTINFGKVVEDKPIIRLENIIHKSEETRKMFVLLVEDDLLNQFTIKRFIEKKHTAIVADSSEKALEILNNGKVDLILMDISIRGSKNGLELTRELKASKEFSHIPVIAITAHAFESDKQKALEAGCDSFLPKPFSKDLLLSTINALSKK